MKPNASNYKDYLLNKISEDSFSMYEFKNLLRILSDGINAGAESLIDQCGRKEILEWRFGLPFVQILMLSYLFCHKNQNISIERFSRILSIAELDLVNYAYEMEQHGILQTTNEITDISDSGINTLFVKFNQRINDLNSESKFEADNCAWDYMKGLLVQLRKNTISPKVFRYKMMYGAKKNPGLQFCKGLLELDGRIKENQGFVSLMKLAEQFIDHGIEPIHSFDCDELVNTGLADIILVGNDDDSYANACIISTKACKKLFYGHPELIRYSSVMHQAELIKHEDIPDKPLFFDKGDEEGISMLRTIMNTDNFSEISARLESRGRNSGVSILLYGASGCGKTALALSLAKQAGRDVFVADPGKLNMSHVGESEKAYKNLFRSVKYAHVISSNSPILLFNEADGIFSRRLNANSSCEKLDNTIQTILLQELENFEGLFIATTNVAEHLDSAFERRFLFKMEFNKPSEATRVKILESMMPEISRRMAKKISSKYQFSGGQLDNVTKKVDMYRIIYGKEPNEKTIINYCNAECIEAVKSIKGFIEY